MSVTDNIKNFIKMRDDLNKELQVTQEGVYKFRFYNSNIFSSRECKIKIQRVPANNNTRNFNTAIRWETFHDTIYKKVQEKYLVKSDTTIYPMWNSSERLTPGQRKVISFSLPDTYDSWAFWIGSGNEAELAYEVANLRNMITNANIPKPTSFNNTTFNNQQNSKHSPILALALDNENIFPRVSTVDPISYAFMANSSSSEIFRTGGSNYAPFKQGNSCANFAKMPYRKGPTYLGIANLTSGKTLDVKIEIIAVKKVDEYATREVEKMEVNVHKEPFIIK